MRQSMVLAVVAFCACLGEVGAMPSGFDAGTPGFDAGTPSSDAGTQGFDAGTPSSDAGTPGYDAGTPGYDAGTPGYDAGTPGFDAGTPPKDAGTGGTDAGAPPKDAGTGATDAGTPPKDAGTGGTDAGTSPPDAGVVDAGTPPPPGAPLVLYTDALTGPTHGGENDLGCYLSIFGRNFGTPGGLGTTTKVFIGDKPVANYRSLGPSQVGAKLGIEQLTVQVGALGGAAAGTALSIRVEVAGTPSNTNFTFTPTNGRVLFASLQGDDTSAAANDISKPWRHLQVVSTGKGAYYALQAGDHLVLRGGTWADALGADTTLMRFLCSSSSNDCGGLARNGTPTGWIHVTAYPGETVVGATPANASGGIAGPWSAIAGKSGEYISVSNLHFTIDAHAARDAAPINFQYTAGHWRAVNNELGPWPVASDVANAKAAGVAGHGDDMKVIGNEIHHIAGTSALENHGIYADTTAQNWEVAYNHIHDITGGSLVQFNDNEGGAGTYTLPHGGTWEGFVGIRIHHNWLERGAKYGINFNDQGATHAGRYEAQSWNNVIIGTALYPLRLNTTSPTQNLWFAFNTMYDCMTGTPPYPSLVMDEGLGDGPGVRNVFFNNIFAFGPNTNSNTQWEVDYSTPSSVDSYNFKRNVYSGGGAPTGLGDSQAIHADPNFTNAAGHDLTLVAGSPARATASYALPVGFTVVDDFRNWRRPGSLVSLGAYEASP